MQPTPALLISLSLNVFSFKARVILPIGRVASVFVCGPCICCTLAFDPGDSRRSRSALGGGDNGDGTPVIALECGKTVPPDTERGVTGEPEECIAVGSTGPEVDRREIRRAGMKSRGRFIIIPVGAVLSRGGLASGEEMAGAVVAETGGWVIHGVGGTNVLPSESAEDKDRWCFSETPCAGL